MNHWRIKNSITHPSQELCTRGILTHLVSNPATFYFAYTSELSKRYLYAWRVLVLRRVALSRGVSWSGEGRMEGLRGEVLTAISKGRLRTSTWEVGVGREELMVVASRLIPTLEGSVLLSRKFFFLFLFIYDFLVSIVISYGLYNDE